MYFVQPLSRKKKKEIKDVCLLKQYEVSKSSSYRFIRETFPFSFLQQREAIKKSCSVLELSRFH